MTNLTDIDDFDDLQAEDFFDDLQAEEAEDLDRGDFGFFEGSEADDFPDDIDYWEDRNDV